MAGYNHCTFVGNVGRDPEMRTTKAGKDVANFSVGVNERKDQDTLWVNVSAFDKLAGLVKQYVTKGRQILVAGRLNLREYDAKDGSKKTAVELIANTVTFLGGKEDGDSGYSKPKPARAPSSDSGSYGSPPVDDEIPF